MSRVPRNLNPWKSRQAVWDLRSKNKMMDTELRMFISPLGVRCTLDLTGTGGLGRLGELEFPFPS